MKTLIVKTSALGDVLRTTILLSELEGEIYWITKNNAKDLLNSKKISKVVYSDDKNELENLKNIYFDIVISLEENRELLELLNNIKKRKLIGLYLDEKNNFAYSEDSNEWFDMSLVSKYSRKEADSIKMRNRKTHSQIFIEMIGKKFNGQEYDLGVAPKNVSGVIGVIDRCGGVWPNKEWSGYDELRNELRKENYKIHDIAIRPTLKEHIKDINNCELIVCGDTLGMHIALALKKKVVSLFNCTPPHEIYDYGRMIKIVSPLYEKYFFSREKNEEVIKSIPVEEVYNAVKSMMAK